MRHVWTSVVVDGFAAGETDFAARLATTEQSVLDRIDSEIISPVVNGIDGVVLTIAGYSDVVDTGEAHRTCLEQEAAASWERANTAQRAILDMIGTDWLDPPPAKWADLPFVGVYISGRGAAGLVDPGSDEAARRRNRRVRLAVCRFTAEE